jgi:hypothetical protein
MSSPYQTMAAVPHVYVLPRCNVDLYESGSDYSMGALAWSARQVDNLRVSESFDVVPQVTTGVPYPEPHHTTEHHEITFDAVWNVAAVLMQRISGSAQTGRNAQYVMVITFLDGSVGTAGNTITRTYYGVTLPSRTLTSRQANEFGSSNTLTAKYYTES